MKKEDVRLLEESNLGLIKTVNLLLKALEFYAKDEHYEDLAVIEDGGEVARKALGWTRATDCGKLTEEDLKEMLGGCWGRGGDGSETD